LGSGSGHFCLSMMDKTNLEVEISLVQIWFRMDGRRRVQVGLAAKRWVHCSAIEEGYDWHDNWRHTLDRIAIGGSFSVNDFNFRYRPRFSILLASLSVESPR
jgi:hypothetical protein